MPVLKQVGDAWESGELGVLHEHFVSSSFRGVLGELRMPVQGDQVRTVVLACPPRELHDLPLELFGAMLHARWWRVVSLGANTPMTAVGDAVRFLRRRRVRPRRRAAQRLRVTDAVAHPARGARARSSSPARAPLSLPSAPHRDDGPAAGPAGGRPARRRRAAPGRGPSRRHRLVRSEPAVG